MKTIPLSQGKFALVDDEDYELVMKFTWSVVKDNNVYYAATRIRRAGKRTSIRMHQIILQYHHGPPDGLEIDHRNRNGLDNQKHNIWYCTTRQNAENRRDNTSGFPGVSYFSRPKKWAAQACVDGKNVYLGYYSTPEEAHEARVAYLKSKGV